MARADLPVLAREEIRRQKTYGRSSFLELLATQMRKKVVENNSATNGQRTDAGDDPGIVPCHQTSATRVRRTVIHPHFGKGTVLSRDDKTYSIPFVIAKFKQGVIARPECEFNK